MSRKRFWKPISSDQWLRPNDRQAVWLRGRTEDRFARRVTSLDELDPDAQEVFRKTLRPGEQISWLIYAPFQAYLRKRRLSLGWVRRALPWEYSSDWVIALTEERLLLMPRGSEGKISDLFSIPFENILSLQNGAVLLFSWFEVQWAEAGAVHQQVIYYNAVCTDLFTHLSEMIRCRLADAAWIPAEPGQCSQSALEILPYKFKNMILLHSLLDGEQVNEVFFRPALWKRRVIAFRTMIAPRLAAVLTNLHLILTEEDLTGSEGSYGFISTFLPLSRVSEVVMEDQRLAITLSIQSVTKKLFVDFPAHKLEEAANLASACERILPMKALLHDHHS